MLRNTIYYNLKPFIPQRWRTAIRRNIALRQRNRVQGTWPIIPGSERPPEGWPGWPQAKKFALVLTHDVESQNGLDKCRELMRLEMEFGFRSSFNFVPEGSYRVPAALRQELAQNGFEIGVHDLKHDGRLFVSRREFSKRAARINHYIHDWSAVGFRAGFMLHKLDWFHDLDIQYDASTFDTDPFEPQPEGRHTIFPFWVARPPTLNARRSTLNASSPGYVELPYTLPQDSTLFLLLRERSADLWLRKLEWIAQCGGMALVIIHPDYVDFTGDKHAANKYPVSWLRDFLENVSHRYSGAYWNPCAGQLAQWYQTSVVPALDSSTFELGRNGLLRRKRAAVLLYSHYPADPRPRRAAEAMIDAGMEVDLICLRETGAEPKREALNGVNILRLPLRKQRHSKLTYIRQYGTFLLGCLSLLAIRSTRRRYDFVHVHNMPDVLVFGALIPKVLGAKVILDLHDPMPELMLSIYNLPEDDRLVRWLKRLEKMSIAFADLVLTPNKAFRELFISRSCVAEKIEIVMNSPESEIFDIAKYPVATETTLNGSCPFKIMYHGLIVERHGLDTAIQATALLRSTVPQLEFHIFGGRTAYMNEIEMLIKQLGLTETVHYHGYRSQTEIARAIADADLGLIPNRRNPFTEINMPTRIFEYIAMRKPVVVPDTAGIRDYFEDNSALFFEPNNAENLADIILQVFRNPEKFASTVAQSRKIYETHCWEIERTTFLNAVSSLLLAAPTH
jgi:glycosyltransferase involved in cell wall biosynthesis